MQRELSIQIQDGPSSTVHLTGQRLTLGRAADNELPYPDDPVLSRRHLTIEFDGTDYWVEDLRSKNGTVVNGGKLNGRHRLRLGDRIAAGRVTLVFDDGASQAQHTVVFVPDDDFTTIAASQSTDLDKALDPGADVKRMKALLDAGRELDANRPLPELFSIILELAVKSVGAQRGVVLLQENNVLAVKAAKGDEFLIPTAVRDQVMELRNSVLTGDTSQDAALRGSMTIVAQRIKSLIAVPLQTKEKVIGLIYVDSPDIFRPFTYDDLTLLTVMANIAAVRIENARLAEEEKEKEKMSEELRRAAEIQMNLLPRSAPQVEGFDIHGFSLACRSVGGDYYDYLPIPGGKWAIIVGDVAGKGMPAALLMSSLQARVQLLTEQADELGNIMTRLNRAVSASCPGNRFITFFLAIIDPGSDTVDYCNAGHNPPYLLRANGSVETLTKGGPVLGILKSFPYQAGSVSMNWGDTLVMFSDGVTEARSASDEEYGEERLLADLEQVRGKSAREIGEFLYEGLEKFMGVAAASDDITLVVVRKP